MMWGQGLPLQSLGSLWATRNTATTRQVTSRDSKRTGFQNFQEALKCHLSLSQKIAELPKPEQQALWVQFLGQAHACHGEGLPY